MKTSSLLTFTRMLGLGLALSMTSAFVTHTALAETKQPTGKTAKASGVVNLNTATAEQLTRLPGVGPSRAKAILDLRARLKRFKRIEDVMRVRGVGRKTFRLLRPMLRVEGETTL